MYRIVEKKFEEGKGYHYFRAMFKECCFEYWYYPTKKEEETLIMKGSPDDLAGDIVTMCQYKEEDITERERRAFGLFKAYCRKELNLT